jgi:hypothetical protein
VAKYDFTNVAERNVGETFTENDHDLLRFGVNDLMTPPHAQISQSSQAITNDVITTITFGTEDADTDGMANLGVSNDRLTVQRAGWYLAYFNVDWDAPGGLDTEYMAVWVTKNGTSTRMFGNTAPSETAIQPQSGSMPILLAALDFVHLRVVHTGVAARTARDLILGLLWVRKP